MNHFFFYQGFLKGGGHLLFHSTTSTRSRTFATLLVRWLLHSFNRIVCIYQNATRWVLPPYWITIWLIDDVMLVFPFLRDDLILDLILNVIWFHFRKMSFLWIFLNYYKKEKLEKVWTKMWGMIYKIRLCLIFLNNSFNKDPSFTLYFSTQTCFMSHVSQTNLVLKTRVISFCLTKLLISIFTSYLYQFILTSECMC